MRPWIEDESRTVDLADGRLNKRYRLPLDRLSGKPTPSIPAACKGWSETQAAYRFHDNERVTPENLLEPHYHATPERMGGQRVVLIAQDTTEFDRTRPREKIGGSPGDENHWGPYDHVAPAVTPERLVLGVVDSFTRARRLGGLPPTQRGAFPADRTEGKVPVVEGLSAFARPRRPDPADDAHPPVRRRRGRLRMLRGSGGRWRTKPREN